MTSEDTGTMSQSLQTKKRVPKMEKNTRPDPATSSTSRDAQLSGTTNANSDTWPVYSSNSCQGNMNPSMPCHYGSLIPAVQIPLRGRSWSDGQHTCRYSCYQSQCPKRQASSHSRQNKYMRTDLRSGQVVERCGFGPGRGDRQQEGLRAEHGSRDNFERRYDLPHSRAKDQYRSGASKGGSNFHRHWTYKHYTNDIFHSKSNNPTEDGELPFTVASYNILAQNLLEDHRSLYAKCDKAVLEWEYRSRNLLEEIKLYQPDILCMQEVNVVHYEGFFEPELEKLGYSGQFKKRTGRLMDGCATFFKMLKFRLKHCEPVEYSTRSISVLNRDNVALVLLLTPVLHPGCTLCVANTHLLFNPRRGDVKLAQLMVLLSKIDQLTYKGLTEPCMPIYDPCILCGDFNSMPDSHLYKLLNNGQLKYKNLITRSMSGQEQSNPVDPYENRMTCSVLPAEMSIADQCHYIGAKDEHRSYTQGTGVASHRLNLQSVYKHENNSGEKEVTTHHKLTNETVDYIFYSLAGPEAMAPKADANKPLPTTEGPLKLMGSLQLMTSLEMEDFGDMPNRHVSSDHLILMAEFLWDLKYYSPVK